MTERLSDLLGPFFQPPPPIFSEQAAKPPLDRNESCGNCRYSDPRIGDDGDPYLRCRRYPPVVTDLGTGEPMSVFSQTAADEWCGEWQADDE